MDKKASQIAKNLKGFKKIVSNIPNSNTHKVTKNLVNGGGYDSVVLDLLGSKILKKSPKARNFFQGLQEKTVDLDMKAGAKVYDTLTHKKVPKKLKGKADWVANKFTRDNKFKVKLDGTPSDMPELSANVKSTSLLAPVEKARDVVLPIAGSFGIADMMSKDKKKDINNNIDSEVYYNMDNELLKKASESLMAAAKEIRVLKDFNEKLALENQNLHLEKVKNESVTDAKEIANKMLEKGVLPASQFDEKVKEIMSLDSKSKNIIIDALDRIEMKEASENIDKLAYVIGDGNKGKTKATFKESFE